MFDCMTSESCTCTGTVHCPLSTVHEAEGSGRQVLVRSSVSTNMTLDMDSSSHRLLLLMACSDCAQLRVEEDLTKPTMELSNYITCGS